MLAPDTVNVALDVAQIVFDVAVVVNVGIGLTFTVAVAGALLQPALVPVTVYTVVAVGEAVGFAALGLLNPVELIHVYVVAPLAVITVLLPLQIVYELAESVKVGIGFTITLIVFVPTHPAALVPLTVYVAVPPGVTVAVVPLPPPALALQV